MKSKNYIALTTIAIFVSLTSIFLSLTLKNSKDCSQLVIDTNEMISGIDIPQQTSCDCFYDAETAIRVGVYTINNTVDFIKKYGLAPISEDKKETLWAKQLLIEKNAPLPTANNSLFQIGGNEDGDTWQCLLDKNSGKMWFEVKWKS